MTVAELLARISSKELTEWQAYFSIEPPEDLRADYRAALITSTIANVNRKRGSKAVKPVDLMPKWSGAEEEAAADPMAKWLDFVARQNASDGNAGDPGDGTGVAPEHGARAETP